MRALRRTVRFIVVGSVLSTVVLALQGQADAVGTATGGTDRVSVSSTGGQGNNSPDGRLGLSTDGRYVVFASWASNLVPGDTNEAQDVFVRDRQSGTTARVSVPGAGAGAQANGHSADPAISADGRYVTFRSQATNLIPGDTNATDDVFIRDRQAGTTRRVSISGTGAQANGASQGAVAGVSANGRYIAFVSTATNLVPTDTNARDDVFLRDMQTGVTRRISVSGTGAQANRHSYEPAISADGRYVTFHSDATNLVPADTNGVNDVFLRDWQSAVTRRISVSGTGAQANQQADTPTISADGRYIAFESYATNLVPGDTNVGYDVFLRDWQTGVTRRISVSGTGAQANGSSLRPAISPDGRYVAFDSDAPNLVPGDTNAQGDVFVRDWQGSITRRVSVSDTGMQGNSLSIFPAIGSGGRYVAFHSYATNLVPGDTNGFVDVFVRTT
ncbi:MAG: hypothetical protein DLM59_02215 [Pseudonocardiales bacterium]|nr:MAG: hypothetical protein DLM59_02215 [Pseudonocardiales bacterium]